jgi:hypothetical protein
MVLDDKLILTGASGQTITVSAPSTDVLDTGVTETRFNGTRKVRAQMVVKTAFTAAGLATLNMEVEDSPDNSTWTKRVARGPIPKADLVAGAKFEVDLPGEPTGLARYIRIYFTVGTGPMTAGVALAHLIAMA